MQVLFTESNYVDLYLLRSINGLHPKPRKVLQLLRLRQINNGVFIRLNKATINMLRLAEPYITWGSVILSHSTSTSENCYLIRMHTLMFLATPRIVINSYAFHWVLKSPVVVLSYTSGVMLMMDVPCFCVDAVTRTWRASVSWCTSVVMPRFEVAAFRSPTTLSLRANSVRHNAFIIWFDDLFVGWHNVNVFCCLWLTCLKVFIQCLCWFVVLNLKQFTIC